MKKFISMVMAAAMVVSLVPATAFAATDVAATAKVVDALELTEKEADAAELAKSLTGHAAPEVKVTIDNADYTTADYAATAKADAPTAEITLKLDNAEFNNLKVADWSTAEIAAMVSIELDETVSPEPGYTVKEADVEVTKADDDEVTFKFYGCFEEDDVIIFNMNDVMITKTKAGAQAAVSVKSKDLGVDKADMTFVSVLGQELAIEADDTVDVAPEEIAPLEEITIEVGVGALPYDDYAEGKDLKLKLSKGFEFAMDKTDVTVSGGLVEKVDDDVLYINVTATTADEITVTGLKIEATTAKAGDVATLTVSAKDYDSASCEVAKVVNEGLTISVEEDEDVPVMWSGVNQYNDGLTAENDEHWALEVTVEEAFQGSYNEKDEIEFTLPEGVWVTNVKAKDVNGTMIKTGSTEKSVFEKAYNEGEYEGFVFEKRTFNETEPGDPKAHELTFELELVADPGFVGDVALEMLVDGESVGSVVIAKFETPLVVEAQQNDLKIDYRNTAIGSDIVVKEAEAGLWEKDLVIGFNIDKESYLEFEDDVEYTVNAESDMEIDGEDREVEFIVEEESDEEAAVITISNLSLFMQRNIPAGAYDLTMYYYADNDSDMVYDAIAIFAADFDNECSCTDLADHKADKSDEVCYVHDVTDYSDVVKEGFVNVVTAGREQDDASFTTKVVVPVGESYIIAGENTVALDVPAYVSAAGYTMLPVRAVATALGINNNNVLWDQATKTVTILYGQRIITMTVGAKVINVNGSAIPASASVEVVNGRTFLPMRDLATALGVTDITWDAATKTATLNGNI